MHPTSSLSFRPTLLSLEDRAVPATLVELQNITHIVSTVGSTSGSSGGGSAQATADQIVVPAPVARPAARRF